MMDSLVNKWIMSNAFKTMYKLENRDFSEKRNLAGGLKIH